ncbi:MAG: hypothetical protein ACR2HS_04785 [Gammaproteobacteria bacterium]
MNPGVATCNPQTGAAVTCVAGYGFSGSSGGTCTACTSGSAWSLGGTNACQSCGTGVATCNSSTGGAVTCVAGYGFSGSSGASSASCISCTAGKYSAGGVASCDPCLGDTYSPSAAATTCLDCSHIGYFTGNSSGVHTLNNGNGYSQCLRCPNYCYYLNYTNNSCGMRLDSGTIAWLYNRPGFDLWEQCCNKLLSAFSSFHPSEGSCVPMSTLYDRNTPL